MMTNNETVSFHAPMILPQLAVWGRRNTLFGARSCEKRRVSDASVATYGKVT